VKISPALAADLKSLTGILGRPEAYLELLLHGLCEAITQAVQSYLGLSLILIIDGDPITLTAMEDSPESGEPAAIATSMQLPLHALCAAEPDSVIVFYAATAGAFVDFAADTSFSLGLELESVVLDKHLTTPPSAIGLSGLQDLSRVNTAVGILIGQGRTPEGALDELDRRAGQAGLTRRDAAQVLIGSTLPGP
jgi:hypothetical protein